MRPLIILTGYISIAWIAVTRPTQVISRYDSSPKVGVETRAATKYPTKVAVVSICEATKQTTQSCLVTASRPDWLTENRSRG